jgi:DNA replication and repair protein RecF
MRVTGLRVRDFRGYTGATIALGDGLTAIVGSNGAGKTNLLEALYFGCTGRSPCTANERDVVRFDTKFARVEVDTEGPDGAHRIAVGFAPGEPKRMTIDGSAVERLWDAPARPLIGVFLPERLELVKGPPAARRAHVDRVVAALWPARAGTRRAYAQALAQRNALLHRPAAAATLDAWERELAERGIALVADRRAATTELRDRFAALAGELGLGDGVALSYRPRSRATNARELAEELRARRDGDRERGFTVHGPHRDELALTRGGRELRTYASQGEQRLAVLSLLLAEREAIAAWRAAPPLMLLDDVMSELDSEARDRLVGRLHETAGQSVLTATDLDQIPGASAPGVMRVAVAQGVVLEPAAA